MTKPMALFTDSSGQTSTANITTNACLRSLHVKVYFTDDEDDREAMLPMRAPFITPLLSLPSLHTLKLTDVTGDCYIHWTAFRLLLSLPLTHLILNNDHDTIAGCTVDIPVTAQQFLEGDCSEVSRRPITKTLQVLKLPRMRTSVASGAEMLTVILEQYVADTSGTKRVCCINSYCRLSKHETSCRAWLGCEHCAR